MFDRASKAFGASLRTVRACATSLGDISQTLTAAQKDLAATRKRLDEMQRTLKDVKWELEANRRNGDAERAVATWPIMEDVLATIEDRQLDFRATMQRLISTEDSFARFGDGEIRLMVRSEFMLNFQVNSPELQESLKAVFTEPPGNLLLGMPFMYRDRHWHKVWAELWPDAKRYIGMLDTYANSHVTRPVFFRFMRQEGARMWRQVWADKTVALVTGEGSRFEYVPELFDSAASFDIMYYTPTNAFQELDSLLERIYASDAEIILLSLGPAGTVLAHQLAQSGRRALDVGHISNSYLNIFTSGKWPEKQPVTRAKGS